MTTLKPSREDGGQAESGTHVVGTMDVHVLRMQEPGVGNVHPSHFPPPVTILGGVTDVLEGVALTIKRIDMMFFWLCDDRCFKDDSTDMLPGCAVAVTSTIRLPPNHSVLLQACLSPPQRRRHQTPPLAAPSSPRQRVRIACRSDSACIPAPFALGTSTTNNASSRMNTPLSLTPVRVAT